MILICATSGVYALDRLLCVCNVPEQTYTIHLPISHRYCSCVNSYIVEIIFVYKQTVFVTIQKSVREGTFNSFQAISQGDERSGCCMTEYNRYSIQILLVRLFTYWTRPKWKLSLFSGIFCWKDITPYSRLRKVYVIESGAMVNTYLLLLMDKFSWQEVVSLLRVKEA